MIALACLAVGSASAATVDLRPVVADVDAPARFAAWRASQGLSPAAPACDLVWPEAALVCLRVWEGGKRRWVLDDDLRGWGLDFTSAKAQLAAKAREVVLGAELVPVAGMTTTYLRIVDGDGWAAAGLLRPDVLVERLGGGPIRVAVPAETVLVAWRVGGPELDQVMAVGARELYEVQRPPVSPRVYTWDGSAWTPFGEAVPKGPPQGPARP